MPKAEAGSVVQAEDGPDAMARELREALQELQKNLRGILGSVIVDRDGAPLAWELRGGAEPMLVATSGAMLARAIERTGDLLDLGEPRNVVLTTTEGSLAVFRIHATATLVVLLQPTANNILVTVEVGKTLERLRGVMGPGR